VNIAQQDATSYRSPASSLSSRSGSLPHTDLTRFRAESEPDAAAGAALDEAMGWIEYRKTEFKTPRWSAQQTLQPISVVGSAGRTFKCQHGLISFRLMLRDFSQLTFPGSWIPASPAGMTRWGERLQRRRGLRQRQGGRL